MPLYRFTCDKKFVSSSYNPRAFESFWYISSPSFSNVWSLSVHFLYEISLSSSSVLTAFKILCRNLYTVDFPVPVIENKTLSGLLSLRESVGRGEHYMKIK